MAFPGTQLQPGNLQLAFPAAAMSAATQQAVSTAQAPRLQLTAPQPQAQANLVKLAATSVHQPQWQQQQQQQQHITSQQQQQQHQARLIVQSASQAGLAAQGIQVINTATVPPAVTPPDHSSHSRSQYRWSLQSHSYHNNTTW